MNTNHSTSLGLPEPVERVGAYALGWVSGLILLLVERNSTVRHHARQSLIVFGLLSILGFIVWVLGGFFHLLPFIGGILAAPFGLLGSLIWFVSVALWVGLMIGAALFPHFALPGVARVQKRIGSI